MAVYNLDISYDQVNRVFPFHIIINKDAHIKSLGKSCLKMGLTGLDLPFGQVFHIQRPVVDDYSIKTFESLLGNLVYLKSNTKENLILRGELEYFENEEIYIFLGSPWFGNMDDLKKNNLTIHDFAKHDPLLDLLHILKAQEITNTEIKELLLNVTSQKKKAEVVNKKLQLLQSFLDSSTDAIQVSLTDGGLYYLNNEASKRLGINPDEAQKYNVSDFEQIFKDKEFWNQHVQELRDSDKIIVEGVNKHQETGIPFPVEVTVKLAEIGGTEFVIASSRDISSRKAIESKLIQQEKKYRNIIANMNLGLLEVDLHENIMYANQSFADMSGFEIQELVGNKATEILNLDTSKEKIISKGELRQKGISDNYEIKVRNKAGETRWWFISGAPNYNDNNELIGSIGIHLDITKQKSLEHELGIAKNKAEDASKAKEAFLANMSHEIRTPLNAIIGMIRELKREDLSKKQQSYLNHTDTASKHLLSIVNSILDISKIEAGEFQLESQHFSLEALVGNIQSILFNKAKQKGLEFNVNVSNNIFPAYLGDSARLRQVLINLLDNAIKFTPDGFINLSVRVIEVEEKSHTIEFVLTDTGIGMNSEYLDQIFSKFTQEEKSTSRKFGGTGLGMSITKEIIQLMGGTIDVWSEKNKGTKITIRLNLPKGNTKKLIITDGESYKNGLEGIKVLLVEDNVMNRFIAIKSLNYFGCQVEEAENGKVALEKVKEQEYDVILMDIQMPEMDGVETTKAIRNDLNKDTPIIAVSANAFRKDIDLYLSIGMNDYVTKPFNEAELFHAIQNHLNFLPNNYEATDESDDKKYNIEKLIEISAGDKAFVKNMIDIFIEHTPQTLLEINDSLGKEDYTNVSRLAHRIKPNIEYLGMVDIHIQAKEIELLAKQDDFEHEYLAAKVVKFNIDLKKAIAQLMEDFQ